MTQKRIILDASIAVKILHTEPDSENARELLEKCILENREILVPEHFLYEVMNVCQRLSIEAINALTLFDAMKESIVTVMTPQRETWLLAEKISRAGHQKSGFPTMYDSIYHALAVETNGIFVTSDQRHFAKTQHFYHICLLKHWRDTLL